jgi:hypothetical protein
VSGYAPLPGIPERDPGVSLNKPIRLRRTRGTDPGPPIPVPPRKVVSVLAPVEPTKGVGGLREVAPLENLGPIQEHLAEAEVLTPVIDEGIVGLHLLIQANSWLYPALDATGVASPEYRKGVEDAFSRLWPGFVDGGRIHLVFNPDGTVNHTGAENLDELMKDRFAETRRSVRGTVAERDKYLSKADELLIRLPSGQGAPERSKRDDLRLVAQDQADRMPEQTLVKDDQDDIKNYRRELPVEPEFIDLPDDSIG